MIENISKKYEKQKKFFNSGTSKSIQYRINSLKKLKKNISLNENEIINALKSDLGKSETETFFSEIALIYIEINLALKNVKRWSKKRKVSSSLINFLSSDYIIPEPYGVTLNISPWNYPFQLSISPLIGAVAAGNTVILKPSEFSSKTSEIIKKIIENTFEKGHVDVILGGPEIGSKLLDFNWDYIFFTGSVNIGEIVAVSAAKNLTPYTLELGGKSPAIIDRNTDLKLVSKRIVWGKFLNSGQTCVAPDYLIVHKSIKGTLIKELIDRIELTFDKNFDNTSDITAIVNEKNFNRLTELIKENKIIYGGKSDRENRYIFPTIIDSPKMDSNIMKEEIFGPILPVLSFEKLEDIDNIINKNPNPLALYVFSNNKKFTETVINRYSFGGGSINDTIVHLANSRLPFGGVGNSGIGSYHGKLSFELFSHKKSIVNRSTWFDNNLRYAPYKNKLSLVRKLMKYLG